MKGFASNRTELKVDWKIYCLQACACTFQPGNFTGLGSDGVNYVKLATYVVFRLADGDRYSPTPCETHTRTMTSAETDTA